MTSKCANIIYLSNEDETNDDGGNDDATDGDDREVAKQVVVGTKFSSSCQVTI